MASVTAMGRKRKALAAIFSLVRSANASQELQARWWIPITEGQAPNGFSILSASLSEQWVLSPAENLRLFGFVFFCTHCFYFPYSVTYPRGYRTKFNKGNPPRGLTPYPFKYYFWHSNKYIKHEMQCFITRWKYDAQRSVFKRASRCFILRWNTASHSWYYFSNRMI